MVTVVQTARVQTKLNSTVMMHVAEITQMRKTPTGIADSNPNR
jgi:hypothetical protein